MPTDQERIDFIQRACRLSSTGVSIDWCSLGYRFMTFHKVDTYQPSIRESIDAAMGLRADRLAGKDSD